MASKGQKKEKTGRTTTSRKKGAVVSSSVQPSREEIQLRAYEIFMSRGGEPGRDLEDWLLAETELRSR